LRLMRAPGAYGIEPKCSEAVRSLSRQPGEQCAPRRTPQSRRTWPRPTNSGSRPS